MNLHRRHVLGMGLAFAARPAFARDRADIARDIVITWHRLVLELVRHTATYSPPVAARAFGYLGVVTHETLAATDPALRSLGGQLNGFTAPAPEAGQIDKSVALHHALSVAVLDLFGNTGPIGQRAHGALSARLGARAEDGLDAGIQSRSAALGRRVAEHVLAWAATDGGAVIENMGFPLTYPAAARPADWLPTSLVRQQQMPLLPDWGKIRPFAMPTGAACAIPAHPAYDPSPGSPFHLAAQEVVEIKANLTEEQKLIARFWSDDPMLTPTPPGHWLSILLDIAERDSLSVERLGSALAKLGAAQADSFIACWEAKYAYNLLRPLTYIRRHIDPDWTPLLNTPPFPEYPSGHSTQSAASAEVLTAIFGEDFAFDDHTHVDEGLPVRSFPSFWAAAEEAALSRLYGGIHFRFGNEAGTEQGRCVGAYAKALRTDA
ncbi:vanadium-dependent haloperoxidase [Natronohydrobacter thiooxidans]|uniref:vanadium-dependent haloperoxidase n=1 Tax=Natronohydrobacter thiooxidans TaxID=87172 RepID=UPI0008FF48EA|nr:vanadium-dependent haloperoxidase [Natronohydrobacter thiooxidans]